MKINKDVIQKLNPCKDRLDNYTDHYEEKDFDLKEFLSLDNITYTDKIWVFTKLFTQEQNVRWSIKCAESVLSSFEDKYPDDKRPRLALEAAFNYANNPNEETRSAALSAASAARSAARSAAWPAARSAAWSAAYAAESAAYAAESAASAAWSASSAAYAAESAAYAARSASSAAWSAAESAAYVAESAAEKNQEELNLIYLIEVYNETT